MDEVQSAISKGDLAFVRKAVLEQKIDIDDVLCRACEYGKKDIVKFLIEQKADVYGNYNAPLLLAELNQRYTVVDILVSNGVDINIVSPKAKSYIQMKKAYSKWRRVYLRNWIRRVLIPLYFSPENPGGIEAKKDLETIF